MADMFVGEIRMFCGDFEPRGWAFCSGQLLPISQNTALFSLLGTNFGGDGRSTFGLPNLVARMPLHAGGSAGPGQTPRTVGESGGAASVALLTAEMPAHSHGLNAALSPTTGSPDASVSLAPTSNGAPVYRSPSSPKAMAAPTLAAAGGSQAHNNRQPYLAVNFIIALQGIFPPRN